MCFDVFSFYDQSINNNEITSDNEIQDKDLVMKPKFVNDVDYIMNWWKPKAIRRYVKLHDNNYLKPEHLFYGNIVGMSWEETRQQYLGEVGR